METEPQIGSLGRKPGLERCAGESAPRRRFSPRVQASPRSEHRWRRGAGSASWSLGPEEARGSSLATLGLLRNLERCPRGRVIAVLPGTRALSAASEPLPAAAATRHCGAHVTRNCVLSDLLWQVLMSCCSCFKFLYLKNEIRQ